MDKTVDEDIVAILVRTLMSKVMRDAYELVLIEKGTVEEIEQYCLLHARVAVMENWRLVRFEPMRLPENWWRKENDPIL